MYSHAIDTEACLPLLLCSFCPSSFAPPHARSLSDDAIGKVCPALLGKRGQNTQRLTRSDWPYCLYILLLYTASLSPSFSTSTKLAESLALAWITRCFRCSTDQDQSWARTRAYPAMPVGRYSYVGTHTWVLMTATAFTTPSIHSSRTVVAHDQSSSQLMQPPWLRD